MNLRKLSLAVVGTASLFGCTNQTPAPQHSTEPTSATSDIALPAPATRPTTGQERDTPVAINQTPKPVEPAMKLPDDLGGKVVQRSLIPTMKMPDSPPGPKGPRPRDSAIDRGELPEPRIAIQLPSIPAPKGKPAKPTAPPEQAPSDLGQAAAENLSGVKFAEKPLVRAEGPANAGAADVPMFARQLTERTPVDDPTAEISAGKVIETLFPFPTGTLPFLKQSIPDPFEFAEHLKGKLPRDKEFGTVPSVVPPEKK